jgi:AcrR family transcriptional regulator
MAAETSAQSPTQPRNARSYDLRERKRTRTRLMIQTEALGRFTEKGYAQTTVEEIADAAAISPRTFFRYFPTKEDVVLWDEYDPQVGDLLAARPDDEPVVDSFRAIIRETLGGLLGRDPDRLLTRVRLLSSVPELRARFAEEQHAGVEMLVPLLTQKQGPRADDLGVRVIASSLIAAVLVALDLWQKGDGESDPVALVDQAVDALAEGMRELQSSPGAQAPASRKPRHSKA